MTIEANEYDFAVWGTQGGGVVRWINGAYVFVEAPADFPELTVGSEMPAEWGVVAANDVAMSEMNAAADFNRGLDEFFDLAFEKAERREMTLKQVGRFIEIAKRNSKPRSPDF